MYRIRHGMLIQDWLMAVEWNFRATADWTVRGVKFNNTADRLDAAKFARKVAARVRDDARFSLSEFDEAEKRMREILSKRNRNLRERYVKPFSEWLNQLDITINLYEKRTKWGRERWDISRTALPLI